MAERMVPSFNLTFTEEEIATTLTATENILRTGNLALGPYTDEFEEAMADVAQTEHLVSVNSGSTALEIIYKMTDTKDRKILMPSNTNFATAAAAKNAEAQVEFYDGGLYPNVEDIESRLTPDTAALVVVHIGGYLSPELEKIAELCKKNGIRLIEDAAHAHGAQLEGKAAGSFGDAAAFSFFLTKTLTTGEGGAIATDDSDLAALARQYRTQGRGSDGLTHEVWGNSWRMTEIGAALGTTQIKSLEADTERRAAIIRRYQTELGRTGLQFPELGLESRPSGHKAIAILPEGVSRSGLKQAMMGRGVQMAREVYEKPLHQQPIFQEYASHPDAYPETTEFADRHVALPLWRHMPDSDVDKVIEQLNEVLPE
jgi:dTDP-4-amino-4,6-dideoxygalactose transaminase